MRLELVANPSVNGEVLPGVPENGRVPSSVTLRDGEVGEVESDLHHGESRLAELDSCSEADRRADALADRSVVGLHVPAPEHPQEICGVRFGIVLLDLDEVGFGGQGEGRNEEEHE